MNEDHFNIDWYGNDELYADYGTRVKKSSIIKSVAGYRDFIKMNTVDVIKEGSIQAVYDRFLSFLQDMDNQETDAIFKAIAILDDAIEAELAKGPYELTEEVRRSIKEKKEEE